MRFTSLRFGAGAFGEMLVVETVARIRREFFVKGKSIKEIVRDLGVSRNTVRKVIRSGETSFSYERQVQPLLIFPRFDGYRSPALRSQEAGNVEHDDSRIGRPFSVSADPNADCVIGPTPAHRPSTAFRIARP